MNFSFPKAEWLCAIADKSAVKKLQNELKLHPIIAHLLVARGFKTAATVSEFLRPSMSNLPDPFLLPDAEQACERLKQALARNEKIQVYGDYDGDGVTSTALWTRMLSALGADVTPFVPHRKRNGYDLRNDGVEAAANNGCKLILTTDCGIQRVAEVERARQLGMDVVITDHHLPHDTLPNACAVVNPHRADSKYPFRHLAGVGVAFRLGEALVKTVGGSVEGYRRAYIDLCTIGTVTDIMPLALDNRVLVSAGLRTLAESRKPGIRELLKLALLDRKNGGSVINVETISFGIGPRLNAASRMGETDLALNLLMTRDDAEAAALANQLNSMNMSRRDEQSKILTEAKQMAEDFSEHRCLVVAQKGWSSGLIGLVAGKLLESYGRPAIVIAYDEEANEGRGSARSIPAFHIAEALQGCHNLLREYGGHACAAGFSMDPANISALRTRINEIADACLTDGELQTKIHADMVIALEDLNEGLLSDIGMLAPFGNGNPEPIFVSQGCRLQDVRTMGKEKQHLRLTFRADGVNRDNTIEAPLWNMGKYEAQFAQVGSLDVCYTLAENVFNGNSRLQIQVKDLRLPD